MGRISNRPLREKLINDTRLYNRFESKYTKDRKTTCWLWKGALSKEGYGSISINIPGYIGQVNIGVHVLSYILYVDDIPYPFELDHLCRIHNCVNPRHLEVVTHKENILRGTGSAGVIGRVLKAFNLVNDSQLTPIQLREKALEIVNLRAESIRQGLV